MWPRSVGQLPVVLLPVAELPVALLELALPLSPQEMVPSIVVVVQCERKFPTMSSRGYF